jgi:hypothetical protein
MRQAELDGAVTRAEGYVLDHENWAEDGGIVVLTATYRFAATFVGRPPLETRAQWLARVSMFFMALVGGIVGVVGVRFGLGYTRVVISFDPAVPTDIGLLGFGLLLAMPCAIVAVIAGVAALGGTSLRPIGAVLLGSAVLGSALSGLVYVFFLPGGVLIALAGMVGLIAGSRPATPRP